LPGIGRFFWLTGFHYVIFNVSNDEIEVKTYGGFPKEGSLSELGSEINLIDEFVIKTSAY